MIGSRRVFRQSRVVGPTYRSVPQDPKIARRRGAAAMRIPELERTTRRWVRPTLDELKLSPLNEDAF
ncbi:unnamed protein product [Victoria cruziana]